MAYNQPFSLDPVYGLSGGNLGQSPLDTWLNWFKSRQLSLTKSQFDAAIQQLIELQSAEQTKPQYQAENLMEAGMSRAAALQALSGQQAMPSLQSVPSANEEINNTVRTAGQIGSSILGLVYGFPQFSMQTALSKAYPNLLQTQMMFEQANSRIAQNNATLSDYGLKSNEEVALFDSALSAYRSTHPSFEMPDNFESVLDVAEHVSQTDETSIALYNAAKRIRDNKVLEMPLAYSAFSKAYSQQYVSDYYDSVIRRQAFASADLADLNIDQSAANIEKTFQDIYNNHLNAVYTGEQIALAEAERDWYLSQIGLTSAQTSKTYKEAELLGVQTDEESLNYEYLQHMNKVRIRQAEQQLIYLSNLPDSQFIKEAKRLMQDTDLGLVLGELMYAQAIDSKSLYANEESVRVMCAAQNLGLVPYAYTQQSIGGRYVHTTETKQGLPFMHSNSTFDQLFNPNYDLRGDYKFGFKPKFSAASQDSLQP